MKLRLCAVTLVFIVVSAALAQTKPRPPGIQQADQAEEQAEKNIPPPVQAKASVDLVQVGREANELAKISQSIPADIANVQKGILPKDLIAKLKEIEKISKHLRNELSH